MKNNIHKLFIIFSLTLLFFALKTSNLFGSFYPGVIGSNENVCYNISPQLIIETVSGTPGGSGVLTYEWYVSTNNISWIKISGAYSKIYQPPFVIGLRYYKRFTIDTECCAGYTNTIYKNGCAGLVPGNIGSNQSICYNYTPSQLNTTISPTGGVGAYTYQWESSLNETDWTTISGATSESYQPGVLLQTTYYHKKVINNCNSVYTNTVTINVYPQLSSGVIANSQTICYGVAPLQINTSTNASGGSNSYVYEWESSLDNVNWETIPGEKSISYQPGVLTQTTYYRKKVLDVNCNYGYTNVVTINVRANLNVGTIGDDQTVCYGVPSNLLITKNSPSGGQSTYSYQWESSSNAIDWTTISGATSESYQPSGLIQMTFFRRKVTATSCGSGYGNNIIITVNNVLNVGTIGNNQTICNGQQPILLNTLTPPSGGMGSYTYFWESSLNGTDFNVISGAISESHQPGSLSQTTYFRRKVTDTSCGSSYNNVVQITVRPPFTLGDIGSDQTICNNSTPGILTTTTPPTGGSGSYSYQWDSSLDNSNWNSISGANGTSYQPGVLSAKMYFRKSVTDVCGSGYTNSVTISLRPDVNLGTIGAGQTICYNTIPALLTTDVAPSGGTGTFTWLWESSPNNSTWMPIIGAANESYQSLSLTSTMYYRRKVINTCYSGYTNPVVVTVRPNLVSGSISDNQTICYNTTAITLVTSSLPVGGTGAFTWQWQSSVNNSTWSNITGATSETYSPGVMTAPLYYRRSEISGSCGTVQTNSVQIIVNNQLVAGTVKSDQTICYGTSPGIFLTNTYPTGGSGSYTYQWQKLVASTWTDIPSANSETYTSGALTSTTYFRRAETSGSCGTVISNQITVNVHGQFLPGVIGSSQTINYGAVPAEIVSVQSASGGAGAFTYQWQNSLDNTTWSNITGATSESFKPPTLTITKYFKRVTTDGSCGTIETNVITINVNSLLVPGVIKDNQNVCYNVPPLLLVTDIVPSGGNGIYSYQWQKTEDGINWFNITAANSDDYQPGALIQTTYFRKKVTSVSFEEYSNIVTITVNSAFAPGTIGSDQSVCKTYAAAPITTTVLPIGQLVQNLWQLSDNNASWTDITGATNDYYDAGVLTATKFFRKKVTGSCGTGYTNSVKITVNDELQGGTIGNDQAIAYNTSPSLLTGTLPTGGSGTFSYQWYYSVNNIDWQVVIALGDYPNYQPGVLSQKTYFKRKVTDGSCGEKYSNTVIVTVFDNLLPGVVSDAQSICYNTAPATLSGTSPGGGTGQYSYQWQYSLLGVAWNDIASEVGISYRPDALKVNTYYRRAVTSGNSTVFSNFVMIKVYDQINLPTTDLKTSYCKGSTVNINVVNPAYLSYKWFDSQRAYIMDGTKYTLNSITTGNTVYVKSLDLNGCLSDYKEQKIFVDNVKADFTQDITSVTLGDAVKFISTSVNASSYSWNFFEGDIITEQSPVHYYNTLGVNSKKFSVELTIKSEAGCSDSVLKDEIITVVNPVTGIEKNMEVTFSYYPNPVKEKLYLSSNERIKTVKIFNISGKMIKSLIFDSEAVTIDFSSLKSDIYILEINGFREYKKNIKIIKK